MLKLLLGKVGLKALEPIRQNRLIHRGRIDPAVQVVKQVAITKVQRITAIEPGGGETPIELLGREQALDRIDQLDRLDRGHVLLVVLCRHPAIEPIGDLLLSLLAVQVDILRQHVKNACQMILI